MFSFEFGFLLVIRFASAYTSSDYPVEVKLRQNLNFQASVKSKDKTLSVLAENCYATPSKDRTDGTKYYLIRNGLVLMLNFLVYISIDMERTLNTLSN